MKNKIKIFDLKDPVQYEAERNFWRNASAEFKIKALEAIRQSYIKLFNINTDEVSKRLRRVYRITKQKRS
jgi:hypothetical protein